MKRVLQKQPNRVVEKLNTLARFEAAAVMQEHNAELREMAGKAVAAVNAALVATKDDQPDHYLRLQAVQRAESLMRLASESLPGDAKDGRFIYAEEMKRRMVLLDLGGAD